jgi:DNA topoisomerase-3
MKLVIAEKPSMARDIASVLGATTRKDGYLEGNGYIVSWAVGHLIKIENPQNTSKWKENVLPMLGDFILVPNKKTLPQLKVLKGLESKCSKIICATDAGREGELIFRYIYHYLGSSKPFDRLWISSLTPQAIKQGFNNLKSGTDYDDLYLAAKARSESDWLVGINGTQVLTLAVGNGDLFSLGRVQTPTLCMVARRYEEHKNFVSEPFWTLALKTEKSGTQFVIKPAVKFSDENEAVKAKTGLLEVQNYTIKDVSVKEKKEAQPLLFDLTGLQKKASSKFGITPDKTLAIIQKLYESKFLTYPRTGSQYISDDVFATIGKLISACLQLDLGLNTSYYKKSGYELSKRSVSNSKVTDHHAILPTEITPDISELTKDELNIYKMVVQSMFESFHQHCIKDVTEVLIDVPTIGDCKVTGSVIKHAGWREVAVNAGTEKKKENDENSDEDVSLPILVVGDLLPNCGVDIIADKTKPKPLLTDATLLDFMETAGKEIEDESLKEAIKDCGLGTPATRDSIITGLLDKMYIVREKKSLIPTEKGLGVYHIVKDKSIASPQMTGEWEKRLNDISLGKYDYSQFMSDIKEYVIGLVVELSLLKNGGVKSSREIKDEQMPLCPKCKEKHVRLFDSKEKNIGGIGCTDKECGFVIWKEIFGKKLTETQLKILIEKGKTSVIEGFVSRTSGKSFNASLKLNSEFKIEFVFDNPPSKKKK